MYQNAKYLDENEVSQNQLWRWECIFGFPQLVVKGAEPTGAQFTDINEQTWEYFSSLIACNSANERCSTVLAMIFANRRKHNTKSVLLINKIMAAAKSSGHLLEFLLATPPGNYIEVSLIQLFKKIVLQY